MTFFYQTSGIVKQKVSRQRKADLIVVSALIVFGVAVLALLLDFFCIGTSFLMHYEDDTVWFHLDSSRCKYILLLSLQLCCGTPSPPGAPGETEEEIPTRGRSLHPPPQQLAQPLKGLQLFPILWSKLTKPQL